MALRKLKSVEKIILISFVLSMVVIVGVWLLDKQPNRDLLLPQGYEGWVVIQYEVPGAEPFALKEGRQQIVFSESGVAQTSERMEVGWRRDVLYWLAEGKITPIPTSIEKDGEYFIHQHAHEFYSRSHLHLISRLAEGRDTLLWDGTRIEKQKNQQISYQKGRKTLEYFYISAEPQSLFFPVPELRDEAVLMDTDDRSIPVQ